MQGERIKKRDWLLSIYGKLQQMQEVDRVIPRYPKITEADFYRRHYYRNYPCLVQLNDNWAPLRWTHDTLRERIGRHMVEVQSGRQNDPHYERNNQKYRTNMRMEEFLDICRSPSNDTYLTANNASANVNAFSTLWDELQPMELPFLRDDARPFLWIGPENTITPYHHDLTNNLITQLQGTKRVHLVAPYNVGMMDNHTHCYSGHDLNSLNESDPAVHVVDLWPGWALFIPVGWWHHIHALEPSIGCTYTGFTQDNNFHSHYTTYGAV